MRGRDGKCRYHHETFRGNCTQARLYAAEMEARFKRRTGPRKAAMTLGKYLELWLEQVAPPVVAESTWNTYTWHVRQLQPHIGHLELYNLTGFDLQQGLRSLFKKNPVTVQKTLGTLKTALRQAVAWGRLHSDPTAGLKAPRVPRRERRVLTPEELARLLDVLRHFRHGLPVRLLALTGMRLGEVLGLKWDDVDLRAGTVTIRRSIDTKRRKFKVFDEPKTPASRRTLSLDAETVRMLEEHRRRQITATKVVSLSRSDLVFGRNRPLKADSVWKTLRRALKRAGLPAICPHDLRHTAGSLLLDGGVPLATVSHFLGHSNPGVTAAIYAHPVRRMCNVADTLLGSADKMADKRRRNR
ncbi:MAG TPA: site-specific integrase [Desulfotomaculum sp.]|nr:site-specific integrase [Desulfotomaculum sp.]